MYVDDDDDEKKVNIKQKSNKKNLRINLVQYDELIRLFFVFVIYLYCVFC